MCNGAAGPEGGKQGRGWWSWRRSCGTLVVSTVFPHFCGPGPGVHQHHPRGHTFRFKARHTLPHAKGIKNKYYSRQRIFMRAVDDLEQDA
jgi:hypothetical protein